jgi:hypothetical protein
VGLDPIFDEEVVPLHSESHVVLNREIVNSVDSDDSSEGVVHCVAASKGGRDVPCHMEVDAVPAKNLGLSAMGKLSEAHVALEAIDCEAGEHEVRTILGDF